MIPVRTRASNFVYRGPTPDIGDAWCQRVPREGGVYMEWQPSEAEREAIAHGALIRLGIFGREPISPVSLGIADYPALSPAGATLRDLALASLKQVSPVGPARVPAGCWTISVDVLAALQAEGALDPDDGSVPSLYDRPLMVVEGVPDGTLAYVPLGS